MSGAPSVVVCEVGPRDGLQGEQKLVTTEAKIRFVNDLVAAGIREIEVSSFVSHKRVPQMADAQEVFQGVHREPGVTYSALVPNERGLAEALAAKVGKVAVFLSASERFSSSNLNASISESTAAAAPVVRGAKCAGLPVRGYVSCAFGCPYEGAVSVDAVIRVVAELLTMGVDEIDIADTIGVAWPDDISRVLEALAQQVEPRGLTLHLHDTNGRALDCARRALQVGVRRFDSAAGGLGGCPFAPGSPGNMATEGLLEMLEVAGFQTGIDRSAVTQAGARMRRLLASER